MAKIALEDTADYASAVRAAIGFGNDTDTTAAVTGGLAGVRYGLASLPTAWRKDLQGQALMQPLLAKLIEVRTGVVSDAIADGVSVRPKPPWWRFWRD